MPSGEIFLPPILQTKKSSPSMPGRKRWRKNQPLNSPSKNAGVWYRRMDIMSGRWRDISESPTFFISLDRPTFAFAGLWKEADGQDCFTILTRSASSNCLHLHHRMPVILPEEAWEFWLDPHSSPELLLSLLRKPCTGGLVLSSLQESKCHPGGWTRTSGTGSGPANHAVLIVVQAPPKRSKKEKSTKPKAQDHVTALFEKNGWSPFPFQKKAWSAYARGQSGLIHAPTGTGKTYAAWAGPLIEWMDEHGRQAHAQKGTRTTGTLAYSPAGPGQGYHSFALLNDRRA